MHAVSCPACAASAELPLGASTTCDCGAEYWHVPGAPIGEAFTGVRHDRAGIAATLWTVIAAVGVLGALLGILAAETWAVVALIQTLRS